MPRIHADAQAEIRSAASWYDEQVSGLGAKLLAEVDVALDRIDRFPGSGAPWEHRLLKNEVRRVGLRTFPYSVFYVLAPGPIVVAFSHSAREPGYWLGRVSDVT